VRVAAKKITITLNQELADELARAAQAAGAPVSRLVAAAVEHELRLQRGREYMAEWQTQHGEFTSEELAAARAEVDAADAEALGVHARTVA
jgi:hypothetical protein